MAGQHVAVTEFWKAVQIHDEVNFKRLKMEVVHVAHSLAQDVAQHNLKMAEEAIQETIDRGIQKSEPYKAEAKAAKQDLIDALELAKVNENATRTRQEPIIKGAEQDLKLIEEMLRKALKD